MNSVFKSLKLSNLFFISLLACFLFSCGGEEEVEPPTPPTPTVITPSNLSLAISITGLDNNHPYGDGSGQIQCTASATDAVNYEFRFGTGDIVESSVGTANYTYTQEGEHPYTVQVLAFSSTGHYISASEQLTIYVDQPVAIFYDEFDTDGPISADNWFHQTVLPDGGSWFNGEIQHYTDKQDNSYVSEGTLKIVAKKETYTDQGVTKEYTSARLNSKFAFTYGRVEIRAKLPQGGGTWPAIWMLGKNISENGAYWQTQGYGNTSWPQCGEIDIMEHWGDNQGYVQSALHTPSSFGGTVNHGGQAIPTVSSEFHVYSMDWTADKMVFAVDGVEHYTYQPSVKNSDTWPFNSDQYLLLNIAVEPDIDPALSEVVMEIDYIRVYQD